MLSLYEEIQSKSFIIREVIFLLIN